ncbi:hypothetical protein ISCGN_021188 [Ixodes scapularis]|uniref:Mitochondrial cardiolipin hydrolase n=1 Tax=Ixodes scapularis TaxID=6945 RepID=B7PYX8_IXOSC|nr:conserved hypothetical protein [Ixodes scapularis]|eukprot:XP_002404234.1 conserved hypothetical protein [Ixodes scapularis]
MSRLSDVLAVLFGVSILSEVAYQIYMTAQKKKRRPRSNWAANFKQQVIFFPDRGVACPKATHDDSDSCGNPKCCFLHGKTSLRTLTNTLTSARQTLDVCVYMITCDALCDAILSLRTRGRVIRVITNEEGSDMPGSQIGRLRQAGIQVRVNHQTSFLMHHKFALVDEEVLLSGSFNWTRQAITGNHENLLLTADPDIVEPFVAEFQKLWDYFKPKEVEVDLSDLTRQTEQDW